jgi:hypothetical protein
LRGLEGLGPLLAFVESLPGGASALTTVGVIVISGLDLIVCVVGIGFNWQEN